MDFIHQHNIAICCRAKLVFGVYKEKPSAVSNLLPKGKESQRRTAHLRVQPQAQPDLSRSLFGAEASLGTCRFPDVQCRCTSSLRPHKGEV